MAKPRNTPAYNPFAQLEEVREQKAKGSDTQTLGVLGTQEVGRLAKSQDPKFVKLTAYVPRELHRAAKGRLVQQDKEISELVEELLSGWLRKELPSSE